MGVTQFTGKPRSLDDSVAHIRIFDLSLAPNKCQYLALFSLNLAVFKGKT